MSKHLAVAVHLTDENGIVHSFLPGTEVPRWARDRIDNPKAWSAEVPAETAAYTARSGDGIPPKSGRGSSADAWRVYAESKDFDVDADVSRDEIIAALAANNIPTE